MLEAHGTAVHTTAIIAELWWVLYNSGVMIHTYEEIKTMPYTKVIRTLQNAVEPPIIVDTLEPALL